MRQKLLFCIISGLLVLCCDHNIHGQGYVKLRGKQFIDENEQPFYPMVMNYFVDFVYTGTTGPAADFSNCYIAQSSTYGETGDHDYANIADGPTRILQDFYEIKNLGFNVIRLVMTPKKLQGEGYYLEIKNFGNGQTYFRPHILQPYDYANCSDALRFYYNSLIQVIDLAASVDLKVMLICADPGKDVYGGSQLVSGNIGDLNIDDYIIYLGNLASFINSREIHNLFAYEFHGEPTLAEGGLPTHSKSQICAIANGWNSATKDIDPNHLTTVGSYFLDDPFAGGWDANLINVDFTNLHLYLTPQVYLYDVSNATAYWQQEYKRYRDRFYVFSESVKKPFIMGETSFPGRNPGSNPNLVYPIATFGDESEQFNFVEQTFPILRNYGASGYGWWNFQDYHWWGDPDPSLPPTGPFPYTLQDYMEQAFGLLKYGNPDPADLLNGYENANAQVRKLAGAKFVYYKNNPPSMPTSPDIGPVSQTVDMSELYYNPYNHLGNSMIWTDDAGLTYYGTVKGNVKDQNGKPISRAIIKGTSFVGRLGGLPVLYPYYTFSDVNGDFEIRNYDYLGNNPTDYNHPLKDNIVEDIKVSYFGSEWQEIGWGSGSFASGINYFNIKSLQSDFDAVIDNVTVPIGSSQPFRGILTLTAKNVTVEGNNIIGGTSELKSPIEVNLKDGFRGKSGSEVHVFNEKIDVCDEIGFLNFRRANSSVRVNEEEIAFLKEKEIEIHFIKDLSEMSASIYPNPNNGDFTVKLFGNVNENSEHTLRVFDNLGNEVLHSQFKGTEHAVTLTNLRPGFYYLNTNTAGKNIFLKFIIL